MAECAVWSLHCRPKLGPSLAVSVQEVHASGDDWARTLRNTLQKQEQFCISEMLHG